jgi:hypothetical protein
MRASQLPSRSGSTDAMLEASYNAWADDTRTRLLITPSAGDVTALTVRARAARVEQGLVAHVGVELGMARVPELGTSSSPAATSDALASPVRDHRVDGPARHPGLGGRAPRTRSPPRRHRRTLTDGVG